MYDKVKLIIPRVRETPDITGFLSGGVEQTDIKTGEVSTFGSLEGLKVNIFTGCISITGSLAKYLYPNNIYPLDRHSTKEAVQKLSESLHLDITGALVASLEYGTQFVMRQPTDAYLQLLGDMPRMLRANLGGGSLYYQTRSKEQPKTFVFYDKVADAQAKGMVLPKGFEDANLLKYEMRLKGRLAQQMGVPEVKASTLYEKEFYRLLMVRYQQSYFSIIKKNRFKSNAMEQIKTVTDALEVLFAKLISQSNQEEINGFLEDLKQAQVFNDAKYYSRLKTRLRDIQSKGGAVVPDSLIKELDDEIKNVGAYV